MSYVVSCYCIEIRTQNHLAHKQAFNYLKRCFRMQNVQDIFISRKPENV